MADNFSESSPGWVGQKLLRRAWESVEYRVNQINWPDPPEIPQWEPPEWLQRFFNLLAGIGRLVLEHWQGLLLALLVTVLFLLGRWLYGRYGDRVFNARGNELLPEEASLITGTVPSWLAKAEDFRQAKRYGEACRALYFAMLLKLDEAEIIPQRPSRTDREYLYLTQDLPQPDASQLLLETHERLCFSRASANEDLFQHCLGAYQKIEQQVEALVKAQAAQAEVAQ